MVSLLATTAVTRSEAVVGCSMFVYLCVCVCVCECMYDIVYMYVILYIHSTYNVIVHAYNVNDIQCARRHACARRGYTDVMW